LGLRLGEALGMGFQTEEFTRRSRLPQGLALDEAEQKYFGGRQVGTRSWVCRRVELNAFSTPGLIEYTERKLQEAGVRAKVIPTPLVLREHLRAAVRLKVRGSVEADFKARIDEEVESRVAAMAQAVRAAEEGVPDVVTNALAGRPPLSWQHVIFQV